jgi:CHRD domain
MSCRYLPALAAAVLALAAPAAMAQTVRADLHGFQEVPVVSTEATGSLKAKIDPDGGSIFWELTYSSLQGNVLQAHIHLGQTRVNGGIAVWLCGTASNPGPAGTQACPGNSGTLNGVITAATVVGPGGVQQLAAGEFDELVRAIRAGVTYANIHSSISPGGEIRGQIRHH